MQLIQTHKRCYSPKVGRIVLENANGEPVCTVLYDVSPVRRATTISAEDGTYTAFAQDAQGLWHYRYTAPRSAVVTADDFLKDYQPVHAVCLHCGRPF